MTGQLPGIFDNYIGMLDTLGMGTASFTVPQLPWLVGIDFTSVFLVFDPSVRSAISTISNPVVVRVVQ